MTKESLREEINKLGINTNNELLECLLVDTLKANEIFNLTAIKDEDKFRELMIYDSLIPLTLIDFNNKKVLDIGTGAGFPGLVLAMSSNSEFTLLDSTKKKIDHINELVNKYELTNVKGVSARAEEYINNYREAFDIVTARAVSELNVLVELALPFVKVGGYFIALKGLKGNEELQAAKGAIKLLGGEVISINESTLPESKEKRINIVIKKIKETNKKYPRLYKDIVAKPLK